jgi:transposase
MRPYSKDLRIRVVQAYANHEGSMRQLAARFRLSLSCVRDLLTRYRLTGDVSPKPHGGGYPAKLDATRLALVRTAVEHQPDATLQELCDRLRTTAQLTVSLATMSRGLAKLGLPRKKNLSGRRAGASRHPAATRGLSRHPQSARARRPRLSR